jgi:hypothetical protein
MGLGRYFPKYGKGDHGTDDVIDYADILAGKIDSLNLRIDAGPNV